MRSTSKPAERASSANAARSYRRKCPAQTSEGFHFRMWHGTDSSSVPPGFNHVRHSDNASRSCSMCSKTSNAMRSEEHTSELQSHVNLVCRLLLEKKKQRI